MIYKYHKDTIDDNKPFKVHYHLKKKVFSISAFIKNKKGYRVICHNNNFEADWISFKISEKRRKTVIKNKIRDVHAYILCNNINFKINNELLENKNVLSYNPYKFSYFYDINSNKEVIDLNKVYFRNGNVYYN